MRVAQSIELTESENKTLTMWARGRRTAVRVMKRAKVVLLAAKGEQNKTIAERLGMDRGQVSRWRRGSSRSAWRELKRIFPGVAEGDPARTDGACDY